VGLSALVAALAGVAAVAMTGTGKFLAIGLGLYAACAGVLQYRREDAAARARLLGAAGVAIGLIALLLGGAKVGLTVVALDRMAQGLR
jgi:hypothetical protein